MKRLVVLFDIDGTLLLAGGAGQAAMQHAVRPDNPSATEDHPAWADQAASSASSADEGKWQFAGRTDRSIISDFFRRHRIEDTPDNYAAYRERFLASLQDHLPRRRGSVLPGVERVLSSLSRQSQTTLGLLTGNLRRAARMKLSHYCLDHFFYAQGRAIGGFGDVHHDRDDVARDAFREVRQFVDAAIGSDQLWVIGDTPHDVRCARAIGAHVLAVATGSFSEAELQAAGPDLTVADLTQAEGWWQRLAEDYDISIPTFS